MSPPEGDEDIKERDGPRNEDNVEEEVEPPKDPLEAVDFMLEILETNHRGLVLMDSIKPALLDNPDVTLKPATVAELNQAHGQVMEACKRYISALKALQKRLTRTDDPPSVQPKKEKAGPTMPPPAVAGGGKTAARPDESDPAGPEERRLDDGGGD